MVTNNWLEWNNNNNDAALIRREVFVREQRIKDKEEFDDLDKTSTHLVLYDDNKPAAAGRLYFVGKMCIIGRIAVLKNFRGRHIGDMLFRMLLNKGLQMGAERFELSAQTQAAGFYERFGFEQFGGEYKEANIPHIRMKADSKNVVFPRECEA